VRTHHASSAFLPAAAADAAAAPGVFLKVWGPWAALAAQNQFQLKPLFTQRKMKFKLKRGRGTVAVPAVRMRREENILRWRHPRNYRRRRFEIERAQGRNAVTGVSIKTLPLVGRQVIGADRRAGRHGELQSVQPDASQ
jgi:hypothetical protein